MLDLDHPFWIRVVIVAVALGWALVEFTAGAPIWGGLFYAIGLYATCKSIVDFNPRDKP